MAQRGEKRGAWHKKLVNENPAIRKIEVQSIKDYVETARNRLRFAADSLRTLKEPELADSARRLAAEVERFERRANEALKEKET